MQYLFPSSIYYQWVWVNITLYCKISVQGWLLATLHHGQRRLGHFIESLNVIHSIILCYWKHNMTRTLTYVLKANKTINNPPKPSVVCWNKRCQLDLMQGESKCLRWMLNTWSYSLILESLLWHSLLKKHWNGSYLWAVRTCLRMQLPLLLSMD